MTRFRTAALVVLGLSLLGSAAGLVWAGAAFMATSQDAQAAIGVVLGLVLAVPCLVLAALTGLALGLRRRRPEVAFALLTLAGVGVALVVLQLLMLFGPTLL